MIDFAYRTLPSRIMAGFVDGIIIGLLLYCVGFLGAFIEGGDLLVDAELTLAWIYYETAMSVRFGGTIGKLLMRIRIYNVSESGYLTVGNALLRQSVSISLSVIGFSILAYGTMQPDTDNNHTFGQLDNWLGYANWGWGALEIITALFNKKRRAIHDFMGSSVVKRTWGMRSASALSEKDKAMVEALIK